ncbi:MAG: nuclear transport factor 2 family protein [Chitinophagaceae bacterium]|jgi:ketosteroid isomerase-like protein|nr:nuclear transport factor 2 family protein [Chitinophagaceae bacterium]
MDIDTILKNKKLIEDFDKAFAAVDLEFILSSMTDDVKWNMMGSKVMTGKADVKRMMDDVASTPPEIIPTNMVAEGDRVITEGVIKSVRKNGTPFKAYYSDSYLIVNGKIKEMNSYVIEIKELPL